MHQGFDPHQLLAQFAARVQVREVLLAKSLLDQQRHRQRIPESQGRRGAGRRHQVQRARLLGHVAIQRQIGGVGQRGCRRAGHGDEARPEPADGLEQAQDLSGLAAVRQRDHDIVAMHHAEVAVNGLGGVQEEGGRPGAR